VTVSAINLDLFDYLDPSKCLAIFVCKRADLGFVVHNSIQNRLKKEVKNVDVE
jgi:hypothetical protein